MRGHSSGKHPVRQFFGSYRGVCVCVCVCFPGKLDLGSIFASVQSPAYSKQEAAALSQCRLALHFLLATLMFGAVDGP